MFGTSPNSFFAPRSLRFEEPPCLEPLASFAGLARDKFEGSLLRRSPAKAIKRARAKGPAPPSGYAVASAKLGAKRRGPWGNGGKPKVKVPSMGLRGTPCL